MASANKITVAITRADLVRFNLALYPRLRSTYVTILVIAAVALAFILPDKGLPCTAQGWLVLSVSTIVGSVAGFIVMLAISLVFVLFSAREDNGILGIHDYELTETGLKETTSANESLSKWSGIKDVIKLKSYLLVRISSYLFHVIPKRAFESENEWEMFANTAIDYWKAPSNKSVESDT